MDTIIPREDYEVAPLGHKHPGGQQVGIPPAGVKVIHLPTGIEITCSAGRSQMQNRNICLVMLESALTHPDFHL